MKYSCFLILIIIFSLCGPPAHAQERSYRVELLVLRHLDGIEEVDPEQFLRDFSEALDLMPPPEPEPEEGSEPAPAAPEPAEALSADAPTEGEIADPALESEEEEGPRIVLHEEYSDTMRQAWRRLRSSAGFRPEFYLSWEQPDEAPFEVIRVHDLELMYEDDPFADLRAEAQEAAEDSGTPVFGDVPESEQPPEDDAVDAELPDPIRYYRIDGTARLSRSRFLHLDLDIEFRVPDYSVVAETPLIPVVTQAGEDEATVERPPAFRVHRLDQNRQVQTRNLEYFDGPVLGVLALISRIDGGSDETSGFEEELGDSGSSPE